MDMSFAHVTTCPLCRTGWLHEKKTTMLDVVEFGDFIIRFSVNAVAMSILIFGIFYGRHSDRVLATTAAMFNIFGFAVLGKLASVEFSLAAGFGLFAILALFNLRSKSIGLVEIAYFFGAVTIALICSIGPTSIMNVIAVCGVVLAGVWIVDHPALMRGSLTMTVTLDDIDPQMLLDHARVKKVLAGKLAADVLNYRVLEMDLSTGIAVLSVSYRRPD